MIHMIYVRGTYEMVYVAIVNEGYTISDLFIINLLYIIIYI